MPAKLPGHDSWLWSGAPQTVAFRLQALNTERTVRWNRTGPSFANPLHVHSSVAQANSTSNVVYFDQMHSLSVPVWMINVQETGFAKHAKTGRKMYHRGRCKIYAPLQLSSFPKHQGSPSRSASCRSPAVLLASRCQQKMD